MEEIFNIADLFEAIASAIPDREAIVCSERITYGDLEKRSNQLAHYFQSQGVGEGDHVGLYLYNSIEYIEGMLACFKIRAVPININYRYVQDELLYIFNNADLKACIHGREFTGHIAGIKSLLPNTTCYVGVEDGSDCDLSSIDSISYIEAIESQTAERDFPPRSGKDLFIIYTGGTTGMPKGVMWHQDTVFRVIGAGAYFRGEPIEHPDQILECVGDSQVTGMPLAPLMHATAWWSSCIYLLSGNKVVLNHNRSFDGAQVWDIIEQEKVNSISIVGDAMAIPLISALKENPEKWDVSSLFAIGSGGALLSKATQEDFSTYLPNVMVQNAFGSSETGFQNADSSLKNNGLGALMLDDSTAVISKETMQIIEPGSDERGIYSRSGLIPVGYYNDPLKTKETFVEIEGKRWALTGDEATVDAKGAVTIFGRGKFCINSGGEKIFPEEVEEACKKNEAVFDCLVVATPDPRFTEKVTAVVSLSSKASLDLAQLQSICREHLAGYKVPRALCITDEIRRSPSGKPDYLWARDFALQVLKENKELLLEGGE